MHKPPNRRARWIEAGVLVCTAVACILFLDRSIVRPWLSRDSQKFDHAMDEVQRGRDRLHTDEIPEAVSILENALPLVRAAPHATPDDVAYTCQWLAEAYVRASRFKESIDCLNRCTELQSSDVSLETRSKAHLTASNAKLGLNDKDGAMRECDEALALWRKEGEEPAPADYSLLEECAYVRRVNGEFEQANALYIRAVKIACAEQPPDGLCIAAKMEFADCRLAGGDKEGAAALYAQACDIAKKHRFGMSKSHDELVADYLPHLRDLGCKLDTESKSDH